MADAMKTKSKFGGLTTVDAVEAGPKSRRIGAGLKRGDDSVRERKGTRHKSFRSLLTNILIRIAVRAFCYHDLHVYTKRLGVASFRGVYMCDDLSQRP